MFIISNEEMEEIIKIVKSLEESCLLIEDASETIEDEAKQKRENKNKKRKKNVNLLACYQLHWVLIY